MANIEMAFFEPKKKFITICMPTMVLLSRPLSYILSWQSHFLKNYCSDDIIMMELAFITHFFYFISEITEYAIQIGINPKTEPHLLYLAREGLLQAIPPEWQIW